MVRTILAGLAAAALAATAGAAPPQTRSESFSQQGGESTRSADGKWRIFSKAPETPEAEWTERGSMATLWLDAAGRPARRLTAYRRSGSLFWLGGRHALFVHRDMHLQDARLFTLSGAQAPEQQVQRAIEKGMAAITPRLGSVENRLIAVERSPDGALCLSIEESGLSPGRSTGSFVARKGVFRVAPDGAASRIQACPAGGETALTVD